MPSTAAILAAIAHTGALQRLEQVKRLVWLIDTGQATLTIERLRSTNTTRVTMTCEDGNVIFGQAPCLTAAFENLFNHAAILA